MEEREDLNHLDDQKIPTTTIKPIKIPYSGIEYKNKLYICDEYTKLPLSCSELWCTAKLNSLKDNINNNDLSENEKNMDTFISKCQSEYIAKLRQNKKKLGCTYSKDIEQILDVIEKNLYAIRI